MHVTQTITGNSHEVHITHTNPDNSYEAQVIPGSSYQIQATHAIPSHSHEVKVGHTHLATSCNAHEEHVHIHYAW